VFETTQIYFQGQKSNIILTKLSEGGGINSFFSCSYLLQVLEATVAFGSWSCPISRATT
jgi:hypothetical protein